MYARRVFVHSYDPVRLVLVGHHAGKSSEQDFEENVRLVEALGKDAIAKDRVATLFLITGNDAPGAAHRKRIAAVEAAVPKLDVAIVSESRLALFVITALNWLAPARPGLTRSTFSTVDAARAWVLERGHLPASALDPMIAQVRAP
jgi:hypothetical protein